MIVQQYIKLRNAVNIENAWIKMYHFTQKLGEANLISRKPGKYEILLCVKDLKPQKFISWRLMITMFQTPKEISDELNCYFCNIAKDILRDSDSPIVSNTPFEPYI